MLEPAARRVQVHAVFRGLDPGQERLPLPEPLLDGPVRATSGELEVERVAPYAWSVEKGDARELELDFTVALTHRDVPEVAERDAYEHPYVAADVRDLRRLRRGENELVIDEPARSESKLAVDAAPWKR
jgi:hypothetical protein